jgi:PKD repeat protein
VYDATAPSTPSVSAPATGVTGTPVDMTASATDDWSTPVIGWSFGDGAIGFGNSVTHTYTAPGTYTVTATAVDAAGNTKANTATIVVSDAIVPPVDLPTRGVDFNASSVSGRVLVSVPKNAPAGRVLARKPVARAAAAISPPHGYTPFRLLGKDDNIPVGSILDASRGISSITMAADRGGTKTQKGQFSKGVFRTKQTTKSTLTTAVMMGGGNFKRDCRANKVRAGSAGLRAARRRPSRRLFANVKGRVRTRGRHSTATVRGTKYLVKDSCSGTTTRVIKGTVVVRDLVKHRNHVVRTGHRYIARPKHRAKRK